MFEQSLYDIEPVAAPTKEGDLFHSYEIRSWDLGPRIYKIFGIAGAANIFALLVVAQTSLLTMKGCDSPLVSSVCQALDTVVVGATFLGTDRDYIDAEYKAMELDPEKYDVTFVDVSGQTPPLSYPEGYFALANPEQFQAGVEQFADPFGATSTPFPSTPFPTGPAITPPSHSGGSLIDTKPKLPKKNDDLIDGDLPGGIGEGKGADKGGKPKASPSPDDTTAKNDEPKVDPTRPVGEVDLNKRPWTDFGDSVNKLLDAKQVNLDSDFVLIASGKITPEGRLDQFKVAKLDATDPRMKEVLLNAVKAMDASGYLQYLTMFGANNITISIMQKDDKVTAQIESTFKDALRARTMTGLLTDFIESKKKDKSGPDASENDKFDLMLLSGAKTFNQDKKMMMQFDIPKADLQDRLRKKLAEQRNAPKEQNNSVPGRGADNTAKN